MTFSISLKSLKKDHSKQKAYKLQVRATRSVWNYKPIIYFNFFINTIWGIKTIWLKHLPLAIQKTDN